MRSILVTAALLLMPGITLAQCSSGNCGAGSASLMYDPLGFAPPVVFNQPVAIKPTWEIKDDKDTAGNPQKSVFRNGERVGVLLPDGRYFPWDQPSQTFGPEIKLAPATLTELARKFEGCRVENGKLNFGVSVDVSKKFADAVTAKDTPPQDLGKMPLTVRTNDQKIIEAAKHVAEQVKDKVNLQVYPPGHWALAPGLDFGLAHLQEPVRPDGKAKMLHNQNDFNDGEAGLLAAIRKADPTFKAEAVPDLRFDTSVFTDVLNWLKSPSPAGGYPWYAVLGVGALVFFVARRNQGD